MPLLPKKKCANKLACILHIETSAKRCSVAISRSTALLASEGITSEGYIHAEMLHQLIESALQHCGVTMRELQAVSVSRGPGSYTGLRIGISAAKGLCYALGIPLISLDTTAIVASHATLQHPQATQIVSMIDARRMEVYCGIFDGNGNRLKEDQAVIVDETFLSGFDPEKTVFAGDGADKVNLLHSDVYHVIPFSTSAEMMAADSAGKFSQGIFENTALFEPYYLKDYLPGTAKKTLI